MEFVSTLIRKGEKVIQIYRMTLKICFSEMLREYYEAVVSNRPLGTETTSVFSPS